MTFRTCTCLLTGFMLSLSGNIALAQAQPEFTYQDRLEAQRGIPANSTIQFSDFGDIVAEVFNATDYPYCPVG